MIFTQLLWHETNVLDNWQLAVLSQSGGTELNPCLVHNNLSVPLWDICVFSVSGYQKLTNMYRQSHGAVQNEHTCVSKLILLQSRWIICWAVQPRSHHFGLWFDTISVACNGATGSWRRCFRWEVLSSITAWSTTIDRDFFFFFRGGGLFGWFLWVICISLYQSIKIKPTNMNESVHACMGYMYVCSSFERLASSAGTQFRSRASESQGNTATRLPVPEHRNYKQQTCISPEPGESRRQWGRVCECSLIIGTGYFKFLAWSSIAQSVCQWGFSRQGIRFQRPWVRILHSPEEDNLSPFDSKSTCLCQSIKINNNKHIYRESRVQKPIGSEVSWAECSLIIGTAV